jgi:hypothetical protein
MARRRVQEQTYRREQRRGVRLYLEDLKEIEDVLRSTFEGHVDGAFTISSATWVCDSVDDLLTAEGEATLREFEIGNKQSLRSRIELQSIASGATVVLDDPENDIAMLGAFNKLLSIVERRQLRRGRIAQMLDKPRNLVLGGLLTWGTIYALSQTEQRVDDLLFSILLSACIIIMSVAFVVVLVLNFYYELRGSSVVLKLRRDAPGFFGRNRDQIALSFISALIGAVLGTLMTALVASLL